MVTEATGRVTDGLKETHARALQPVCFCGTAVSPGFAEGTVFIYRPPLIEFVKRCPISRGDLDAEVARLSVALDRSAEEIAQVRQQVATELGECEAAIFDAHSAILNDPLLCKNICLRIGQDLVCAEAALADEVRSFATRLSENKNGYMRELSMDIYDIGNRLLRHLSAVGQVNPLADLPPGSVIVAGSLMPSETAGLDRVHVAGIATERGGPTSHAAIIARSLGVPAVTGLAGLMDRARPGAAVLLDGTRGSVIFDGSAAHCKRFAARRKAYEQSRELMLSLEKKACRLKNGTRILLYANISTSAEAALVAKHNLDGIGLYRTEMMYLTAGSAPGAAFQYRQYREAAAKAEGRPVTIRTFDFAPDKHPEFLPFDGVGGADLRGLNLALHQPRLFKAQLRAIIRCAKDFPNVRLLFPMVTGWWDLRDTLRVVKEISAAEGLRQPVPVGAMIETPAAVFALPEILKLVDFISIGCNDLSQYILVKERNNSAQTILESTLHPSLIRAVQQIVTAAAQSECPVCVCGEAASDPVMAAVFVGLGVHEISVSPARAPLVRYALRHLTLTEARKAAEFAMSCDPAQAAGSLRAMMPGEFASVFGMEPEIAAQRG